MIKRNTRIWKVPHLSGGLNTRDARNAIPATQSPDMLNMQWDKVGRVTRRGGFKLHIMDTYDPDPCYGLFRFVKANGDKYLMTVFGTKLVAYKGSAPTYEKHEVANNLTAGVERHFAQLNDSLYMSSYVSTGWGADGVDSPGFPIRWNAEYTSPIGLYIFGTNSSGIIGTATATPSGASGSMNFTNATSYYQYVIVNDYGPLGLSHSGRYTEFRDASFLNATLGATDTTAKVDIAGLAANADPRADRVSIYRTLEQQATSTPEQSANYYYIDTIAVGTDTYTDTKNDSDLVELIPDDPYFHALYPPQFAYCCVHKSRLFIANVNTKEVNPLYPDYDGYTEFEYPSRIYWSDLYQADRIMGFAEVGSDRDKITQIISFNNTLVIFKESTIHVLYGSGPSDFTVREVNAGLGCIAPRSPVVMDNVLIFLGNDGQFHAYDGVNFRRISEAIRPTLEALSETRLELTACGQDSGRMFGSVPRDV